MYVNERAKTSALPNRGLPVGKADLDWLGALSDWRLSSWKPLDGNISQLSGQIEATIRPEHTGKQNATAFNARPPRRRLCP